jgi:two-component system response regulator YesN
MVIDDEPIVHTALRQLLPWEQYGFEWVGTADNGEEALERIFKLYPDLILLDCKMPIMNGLELLEELHRRGIRVKSVILSGHDEFTFAQQAIKWGVSDYVLKPPDLDKLLDILLRLKKEWEHEKRLKHLLSENYSVIRDRFLTGLIRGANISPDHFREQADFLKLPLNGGMFQLALLQTEFEEGKFREYSYEDRQLVRFAVSNIVEETLQEWSHKALFYEEDNRRLVIIVNLDQPSASALRHDLSKVIRNVRETIGISATIGAGPVHHHLLTDGKQAYEDAKVAIEYKYYTGPDTVIYYEDLQLSDQRGRARIDPKLDEKLQISLKVCNETLLSEWLLEFFPLLKSQNVSTHETKTMSLQSMITASNALADIHPQLEQDQLLSTQHIEAVFAAATLDELKEIVERYMRGLLSLTREMRRSGHNAVVEKTKAYIDQHYHRSITLDTIAKEVFVTPVYLSFLFKQVEGVNLSEYITHVRLERAKHLLQYTACKTYDIASQVGYEDEKYFSRIFKKKVGMTPTEFRNQFKK